MIGKELFIDHEQYENPYFVYFIEDDRFMKIGVSKNIEQRMCTLQISNPSKLRLYGYIEMPNKSMAYELEHVLHTWFNLIKSGARNEWFYKHKVIYAFENPVEYKKLCGVVYSVREKR